jgi:hypothetical protein
MLPCWGRSPIATGSPRKSGWRAWFRWRKERSSSAGNRGGALGADLWAQAPHMDELASRFVLKCGLLSFLFA